MNRTSARVLTVEQKRFIIINLLNFTKIKQIYEDFTEPEVSPACTCGAMIGLTGCSPTIWRGVCACVRAQGTNVLPMGSFT